MRETLICSLNKHHIYYLNDANCGFYILMPYKEYNQTNISIRLKSNYDIYDLSRNPLDAVTGELVNYYKNLDNFNVTLILPVFYNDNLSRVRHVNDLTLYQNIDKYFGYIFNNAYMFLSKNGIKVDDTIYIIENDSFKDFTNWYVNRYNSRVAYKTLTQLVEENGSYHDLEKFKSSDMNFVIGKNTEPKIDKTVEIEVETFDSYVKELEKDKPKQRLRTTDNAGFASYILLGIITFGVSILLLSALLK